MHCINTLCHCCELDCCCASAARLNYAFVMYNNLDKWLSPDAIRLQRSDTTADTAAAADDDDDDDIYDDEFLSEESVSRACSNTATHDNAVVNSHIISIATSSSSSRTVHLVEPLTLTLSHIHVRFHSHCYVTAMISESVVV